MDVSLDQQEQQLLEQQRRGFSRLRFTPVLEERFRLERFRFMQRHWGVILVMVASVAFQLGYGLHDLLTIPWQVNLTLQPWRVLTCLVTVGSCLYFRRPQSPPQRAFMFFTSAYLISGLSLVALIYAGSFQGHSIRYEGLLLLLLFGYAVISLPYRSATISGWIIFLGFMSMGLWLQSPREELAYQLLFLACVNLIGSAGTYLQEHAHRAAWLNLKLLNIARRRTEQSTEQKLRILTTVSHDLRQPLNAMGLYAQHLQDNASDEESRRISGRMNASVEQLSRMLQSLLEYNRLSLSGALPIQPRAVALQPLLARLHAETQAQAATQGVALSLHCAQDCYVQTDPVLLERLLRNLLTNALRHADATHIWLELKNHGNHLGLEVGDNGIGMSSDDQLRVFEEFQQLNNPGRNAEQGLGLGLSIVRQLAERLGHDLQLISSPGQGARFVLSLPVATSMPEPEPVAAALNPTQVLLIEDDAASREALQGLLTRWGLAVEAVAGLDQALLVSQTFVPQILISDYRLAEQLDGLQVIAQLRQRLGQALPAILVTADGDELLRQRCAQQDVSLLAKPILPARLRRALALLQPREQPA